MCVADGGSKTDTGLPDTFEDGCQHVEQRACDEALGRRQGSSFGGVLLRMQAALFSDDRNARRPRVGVEAMALSWRVLDLHNGEAATGAV
jgi:hypothetical protein